MKGIIVLSAYMLAALFTIGNSYAQSYIPVDPAATGKAGSDKGSGLSLVASKFGLDLYKMDLKSMASAAPVDKASSFPECMPAPTINDVQGSLDYRRTLLSSSAAVKLGIPAATVTTSGNQMVLVQDYSRTKECLANDNKTRLVYGQTIRTIITIANFDAQTNLTLPAIAANATIAGKSNSLQIQIIGFSNPQIPVLISNISGKELNVESYGDFAKIHSDLIRLTADAATTPTMARLGIVMAEDKDDLKSTIVAAFALQKISDGKSCNDAKAKFKSSGGSSTSAIDQTYAIVTSICSSASPSSLQRAKASDLLQGLKVKY
jgi:hypothetical protein